MDQTNFGVRHIYGSDPAKTSEDWFMGDLKNDPRVEIDGAISEISPGVWEGRVTSSMNPASFRINVRTTNPNAFDIGAQLVHGADWAERASLGYTLDIKDFRNVEMTGYWKVTNWSDDDEYSFYSHGGHNTDGWPEACLGTQYKGQIQRAGNPRFAKEYHHYSGNSGYKFRTDGAKFNVSARNNIWTGQKVCVYDTKDSNNNTVVKCEVWCDESGESDPTKQNWRLMQELVDAGNWGEPDDEGYVEACNAQHQQIFLWGGPSATFRIDNVIVQTKKFSIRNILGVGGAISNCPPGQIPDPVTGECIDDSGTAVRVDYIKFFLSGVDQNNNNPYDAIGGPISNVEILPDAFNNLFDDVHANEQKSGVTSYRCIYVKNQGGSTLNLRAYFNEIDNWTGISLGAKGKNQAEDVLVDDENGGNPPPQPEDRLYVIFDNPIPVSSPGVQALNNVQKAIGQGSWQTLSPMYNAKPKSISCYARKVGSPTGILSCKIRRWDGSTVVTYTENKDVSTLIVGTWTEVKFTKDDIGTTYEPQQSPDGLHAFDVISFEYSNGTATDYIELATNPVANLNGTAAYGNLNYDITPFSMYSQAPITPNTDLCMKVKINTALCFNSNALIAPVSSFARPQDYSTGIVLPELLPGDYIGIWFRRVIPPLTADSFDEIIELIIST